MSEESKDNRSNWIAGLVIAAVISAGAAVAFQSQKTTETKTTTDVLNLPAMNEKLGGHDIEIKENRDSAQKDLVAFEARNQAERNRREAETYDHIDLRADHQKYIMEMMSAHQKELEDKNAKIRALHSEVAKVRADYLEKKIEDIQKHIDRTTK